MPTYMIPTKATQAKWLEAWVARDATGRVVYLCKTWNPDAERQAKARAKAVGGEAAIVAEGRVG